MASWWQFSFRTLFRASLTLKWTLPPPWQHQWCHLIQFFICFQKKLFFFTFIVGNKVFDFEWWFLVKNLKPMNHLKTITMVSMETKFASQDSILDKLSENFTWVDSEKGNRVFTRGALCAPPPPLPAGAPKKPALDRVMEGNSLPFLRQR